MFLTDQINLSDLSRGSRGPLVKDYFQTNPVFLTRMCFYVSLYVQAEAVVRLRVCKQVDSRP